MMYFTLSFIIAVLLLIIVRIVKKREPQSRLKITNLSKQKSKQLVSMIKALNENIEKVEIEKPNPEGLIYVIKFKGNLKATAVESLREEISAIINMSDIEKPKEVIIRLDSPGGTVTGYGLASSQIARLRKKDIPVTVVIDQVAASGGYMMAAVANKVVSAPFAVIGSVGVAMEFPNFSDLLKKFGVKYQQYTAGKYKRTVSPMVEPTSEAEEKNQEKLNATLDLFKKHIKTYRPEVNIEEIATGETWYGQEALDKKMVDEIETYDDYVSNKLMTHKVLELEYKEPKDISRRFSIAVSNILNQTIEYWVDKIISDNNKPIC